MINPTNKSVANANPEIALVLLFTVNQHPFKRVDASKTRLLSRYVQPREDEPSSGSKQKYATLLPIVLR
jgi:hypothetical protein